MSTAAERRDAVLDQKKTHGAEEKAPEAIVTPAANAHASEQKKQGEKSFRSNELDERD